MKLRIVSDLHYEFHRDGGQGLTEEILHNSDFDVLVLAGDIADVERLYHSATMIAEAVAPKPVVYVLGNHEAYGGTLERAELEASVSADVCKNLHILERDIIELNGQRFVGCTLWYEHPGWLPSDEDMGDFEYIQGTRLWLPDRAKESAKFLRETVQPGDVVVTHFLPHRKSILPKFEHSSLNRYFLHNVGDVVEHGEAKLWIHGHTHGSLDYRVGKTRVVCNPFGYAKNMPDEPNPRFNPKFTVEV